MLDEGAGQGTGNNDVNQDGREDNGHKQGQCQGNECKDMCRGEEHEGEACDDGREPFDECGACGNDLMEGCGDY